MLVIAKETLNLLRDEYRKLTAEINQSTEPTKVQLEKQIELINRGEAVKKSIAIMEKVLESKPQGTYKVTSDANITAEEAEKLFS